MFIAYFLFFVEISDCVSKRTFVGFFGFATIFRVVVQRKFCRVRQFVCCRLQGCWRDGECFYLQNKTALRKDGFAKCSNLKPVQFVCCRLQGCWRDGESFYLQNKTALKKDGFAKMFKIETSSICLLPFSRFLPIWSSIPFRCRTRK